MSDSEGQPSPIHRANPIPLTLLTVVLVLAAIIVPLASKQDEGPERLARAEAQYTELVERGVPLQDAAWDPVIAAFESVPVDSKARPEAERRLAVLRERRSLPLPGRPLSRPGEPDGGSPSLDEHGHPR